MAQPGEADMAQASDVDMGQPSSDLAASNSGNMTVISYSYSSGGSSGVGYTAAASFSMGTVPVSSGCTQSIVGACTVVSCILGSADAGATGGVSPVSGGDVSLGGGATPLVLMPMSNAFYPASNSTTQAWFNGGETLHFSNSGGVAPATTITLTAPTEPTITTPAVAGSYTISRASDFPVVWTGGNGGTLDVSIMTNVGSTAPGTPYGAVSCSFPVMGGSGTVPAAALASLPTGSASLRFGVTVRSTTTNKSWAITAVAATYPLTPSGTLFSGAQATIN